ncbi:1-propanol dehydrogenase PduQ [Clostridium algidicarnis]|uniref:1-propanol dehydrogenase PduQ n=1 Tax=Clostridium algidicarnis TaxID=37659 RepID=UPI0016253778|nr:1-propanol dehydrogenase PduQ [Clostridium algidicarnis]MBB6631356.1 iron-containing alcohol dehydrogenase [Clostridium algidicarnis]MBU3192415.1 iron-containing alcohol dehydrogenase [Clostridium algidicarnis]MBU3204437.1 iron-containing alcohol dehydrogenase [Clostridium algidicarnis]MBU3212480.1 iron-containing alcohol dehydrogenase [Clostridium algidicarnis]MBU3222911.1 iron-containing alcohol dehydrogenase [Clostridium algidicarnis]
MGNFKVGPNVYFGVGKLEELSKLQCKRVFIVTDPFMVTSGMVTKVTENLDAANIKYEIFSDIVPDPPLETISKGIKAMDAFKPEALVALGGGSAIDAAKAISHFRDLINKALNNVSENKKVMLIAIPTTSGTGSEVTSFSVVTDKKYNVKYPLVEDSMVPEMAILDATLVKSVPNFITADTGMDVLTHAIEAYVSTEHSDFSDALAEKAIKLVFEYLEKAYKNGNDLEAREKMHNASCIAGMAFTNASLGINHSMAHILGGRFHIPHGKANAILLPYVIEFNADLSSENRFDNKTQYSDTAIRYAQIAKFLNLTSSNNVREGVKSLVRAINSLKKTLSIPYSVKEVNISKKDFDDNLKELSEIALNDSCTITSPRKPTVEEFNTLFNAVYEGK